MSSSSVEGHTHTHIQTLEHLKKNQERFKGGLGE